MSLDDATARNLGLRLGRLPFPTGASRGGRIEVWVHWALIIVVLLELLQSYLRLSPEGLPWFKSWLAYTIALVASVFLHEIGHCYAAYRQGGGAERIVLWPLGGLAYCDAPHEPRSKFWVAAGGPVVTALLGIVFLSVCLALGWSVFPELTSDLPLGRFLCQYLALWNLILLLVNLLPCYPLDGGRMLQSVLWAKLESFGQATYLTLRWSLVTAILALGTGLVIVVLSWLNGRFSLEHPFLSQLGWVLLFVALLYYVEGRLLAQQLAHGEVEEGIFGYDFSRGYTSLERTMTREGKRVSLLGALKERFRQRSLAERRKREALLKRRLDELLVKIHREGMESLTRTEQRFLKRASKLLKK